MKTKFQKILEPITIFLIAVIILFSGSTFAAFNSLINSDHDCCCCINENGSLSDESFKCGIYCCIITSAQKNKLDYSIPVTVQSKEYPNTYFNVYFTPQTEIISINYLPGYHYKSKHQKLYLITSVIRI